MICHAIQQEYKSSVVGTDYDFIVDEDPSTFLCLEFKGQRLREMPDKVLHGELVQPAFVFMAYYEDGTKVDIALDDEFGSEAAAREEALRYATRLGKLPTTLRGGVERIIVHAGPTDATAFSDVGCIALYSVNATKRIATHDLEETLFHESVHASWDKKHRASAEWLAAQESDGGFLTDYGAKNPGSEDLAESALFAYTLLHHPERIPAADAARIRAVIPARIAFVEKLVPPGEPIFHPVGPRYACDGSGTTFTVQGNEEAEPGQRGAPRVCDVDISSFGGLTDVLSNALYRGLGQDEGRVHAFMAEAKTRSMTADELRNEASHEFGIERARLDAAILAFEHVNCSHGELSEPAAASGPADLSPLLKLNAVLLSLLLLVCTATLVVLLKRSRAVP